LLVAASKHWFAKYTFRTSPKIHYMFI
jgi:hypothetical protein